MALKQKLKQHRNGRPAISTRSKFSTRHICLLVIKLLFYYPVGQVPQLIDTGNKNRIRSV